MEPEQEAGGGELLRLAAFTGDPNGGNPAGVWIGRTLPSNSEMQAIAKEVGYSETAFNASVGENTWLTRFYSPEREVPFCGHATIATGVHLGRAHGDASTCWRLRRVRSRSRRPRTTTRCGRR